MMWMWVFLGIALVGFIVAMANARSASVRAQALVSQLAELNENPGATIDAHSGLNCPMPGVDKPARTYALSERTA